MNSIEKIRVFKNLTGEVIKLREKVNDLKMSLVVFMIIILGLFYTIVAIEKNRVYKYIDNKLSVEEISETNEKEDVKWDGFPHQTG